MPSTHQTVEVIKIVRSSENVRCHPAGPTNLPTTPVIERNDVAGCDCEDEFGNILTNRSDFNRSRLIPDWPNTCSM